MLISQNWSDYALLDASRGERLERWGGFTLVRPDPQVIWNSERRDPLWSRPDARYLRSDKGGGAWSANKLPEVWKIAYAPLDLTFEVRAMGFKHTGVFPEQAVNWERTSALIKSRIAEGGAAPKILNLFAYTGAATVAAAKAGAFVCHVDAAQGMNKIAANNAAASGIPSDRIRYIADDCKKFVERELRRGSKYDGVIMDPPSYGRGPTGQVWKLEENIYDFVSLAAGLLSDRPLFLLLNSYTTGLSAGAMSYVVGEVLRGKDANIAADEVGLPVKSSGLILPCGSSVFATFAASRRSPESRNE